MRKWPESVKVPRWRRPFSSLPARITTFVFGVTVLTSLIVTAISVNSIDSFLRRNIDTKFPTFLAGTAQRLDLWYEQRGLELGVFSRSEILVPNVARLASPRAGDRARTEIEQYLAYVLESFPQYRALFLLDADGEPLLWVGERVELPISVRAAAAHRVTVRVSEIHDLGDRLVQLASAPVVGPGGRSAGTLHALLDLSLMEAILLGSDARPSVRAFIVGRGGERLAASTDLVDAEPFRRETPAPGETPSVTDYTNSGGERVVGSAMHFRRFGWTLVVEEPYDAAFSPVVSSISRVLAINLAIVLLFGLAAFRIAVSIVRPVEALSDAARRIAGGEEGVTIPESRSGDEVGVLTRAFNGMTVQLANRARELEESREQVEHANVKLTDQNDELHRVNEILEQLSITDGLTHLHNHRFFQDTLAREAKRADRSNEPLALILADIDHFKHWNDRLGHAAGDEILRQVADVMNGLIRETDLLARYGGEEFALLAPSTDLAGAIALAEKVRTTVSSHQFLIDTPADREPVTVSCGVAIYQGDRRSFFNSADRALYAAKAAGRDCVLSAEDL